MSGPASDSVLLELDDVEARFGLAGSRLSLRRAGGGSVVAVAGVSLRVRRGEMVALVGESGSGKTSTGHLALRLLEPAAGRVTFDGEDVTGVHGRQLRRLRRRMQLIYQDPYEALDARCRVRAVLEEPLRIHHRGASRSERDALVAKALTAVGLTPPESFLGRYPHELSGGQRQRVAIAASIMLEPELVVADEPVSMLDVSVRAEIMALLASLCDAGMGVLLITHDLPTAARYADRIAVMYLGRIVEQGTPAQVLERPAHPYTKALLAVTPRLDPLDRPEREALRGEVPDASQAPSGCRFHPRCPVAFERCPVEDPQLAPVPDAVGDEDGHAAACLLVQGDTPADG